MAIYLDTETTGLSEDDEIVEIAIVDDDGTPLLNTLVKPVNHSTWDEAENIHHITPAMVKNAPTYDEIKDKIREIVTGQEVVIYNADYDRQYLGPELESAKRIECCMLCFAVHYGEYNPYHDNYRWQKLKTAAEYVMYQWEGKAHRALADTLATRAVWRYLESPEEINRIAAIRQNEEDEFTAKSALVNMEYDRKYTLKQRNDKIWKVIQQWWLKQQSHTYWYRTRDFCYPEPSEQYSKVFFGVNQDILWLEDDAETIYRTKKEIPEHLVSQSFFKEYGLWFTNMLKPSNSMYRGKRSGWPLYEKSELERIKSQFPLRFVSGRVDYKKYELITKTDAKRRNIDISGLEPYRETQSGYGDWYFQYKVQREEV